jgi:hypothetical protein
MNRLLSCSVAVPTIFGIVSLVAANTEASITINSSRTYAFAEAVAQLFVGTTIPTHTTLNVTSDGGNINKTTIDWSSGDGQTIFSFDMDHYRPGTQYSRTETELEAGGLKFTANSNEPYKLSGYYDATDVGAPGDLQMYVELKDLGTQATLFSNKQESNSTHNEQFALGSMGGDYVNSLSGSLAGDFIVGHSYLLTAVVFIEAYPDRDSGVSALGNITLKIGTVPEPSTLLLIGIGAISLLGCRKPKP